MPLATTSKDQTMTAGDWHSVEHFLDAIEEVHRDFDSQHPSTHPLADLLGAPLPGALCSEEMSPGEADAVFHPIDKITVADLARARLICFACPALRPCLRRAIENNERQGIWAGTSRRTRLRIRIMIDRGHVTLPQVLDDFEAGDTSRYDRLRPKTENATEEA